MSLEVLPGGLMYSRPISAVITMDTKSRYGLPETIDPQLKTDGEVAPWGENNLFPDEVMADVRASSLLGPLIDWQARKLYGEGMVYGTVTPGGDGGENFELRRENEIDDWLERSSFLMHLQRGFRNWYTYENVFPLFQRSKGNGIAGCYFQDAFKCRLGLQSATTGLVDRAFVASAWKDIHSVNNSAVQKYTALNPMYDVAGQFQGSKEEFMMLPLRLLVDGETYYHLASWDGVRKSGVNTVAALVWKLKEYLLKNQMLIKYHIEVHEEFWPIRYPDWDQKKELQAQRKQDEADAFTAWAMGVQNAGRTLMTAMLNREFDGGKDSFSLWKIHELKMELPKGAYIEDSQEADAHIIRAKGVPDTLFGATPGKKMGAGSGSDKRIAGTDYRLDMRSHADFLLQTMNVVSRVNGWNDRYNKGRPLRFTMRSLYTATLDRFNQVSPKAEPDAVQADV